MRRALLSAILISTAAGFRSAAAQTPSRPAPPAAASPVTAATDPTGIYDFEATIGTGQKAEGRLVIRGPAGRYEGTLAVDGGEILTLTSIAVEKDTVLLKITPPGGSGDGITFRIKFDGGFFAGKFEGDQGGQISGKKVR